MKLYRHHSPEFQAAIEAAGGRFVADKSRRFNDYVVKNEGCLFFYAANEKTAAAYAREDTRLHVYEVHGRKLLDLRERSNRAVLSEVLQHFRKSYLAKFDNMAKWEAKELKSLEANRPSRGIRAWTQKVQVRRQNAERFAALVRKLRRRKTAYEWAINDPENILWGQQATDHAAGVAMRKDLERLGYDGIIFQEWEDVEVALLEPAELVDIL